MENSYTNTVLEAITKALNQGINDVGSVTITIVVIVVLITGLSVIIKFRSKSRIKNSSEESYQKLIRKFNLTILELDLLDKLALSLKKPEEKYILLINKSKLRQAVNRTENLTDTDFKMLEQLRLRLGFVRKDDSEGKISTKSIKQAMPVILKLHNGEFAEAEVYSLSESNITVKYMHQKEPVIPDNEVLMITFISGTPALFNLRPDRVKGELFTAPHTEAFEFEKINTKIEITCEEIADSDSDSQDRNETFKSLIGILFPNGAVIRYGRSELVHDQAIKIFLDNDRKKQYPLYAEVIKISEKKGLASVRFINFRS